MPREIQTLLFPSGMVDVKKFETKPIETAPVLKKPRKISGSEAFRVEASFIHLACLNKRTGEVSYGNGAEFWRKERDKMINFTVANMMLGPKEQNEAKVKIKNDLETQYSETMDYIEEHAQPRGSEFYTQKVLHPERLREVKDTADLGLRALWESELTVDDYEGSALRILGFILLQKSHEIARIRHGVLFRDPFPAYASEYQYTRMAEINRKRNKRRKKEAEITKSQHRAREDLKEFSIPYYQERLEYWEKIFEQLVPNNVDSYTSYKEKHAEEIRKAGGTPEFSVRKEKPKYFEDILKNSDQLAPYSLYAFGLQALRNSFKINRRRSEKIGFKLIMKAFEKAGLDSSRTFNFKGFLAFALYSEYLFKKSQAEPKGHAQRKEAVRQIAKSILRTSEKGELAKPKGETIVPDDDDLPF